MNTRFEVNCQVKLTRKTQASLLLFIYFLAQSVVFFFIKSLEVQKSCQLLAHKEGTELKVVLPN